MAGLRVFQVLGFLALAALILSAGARAQEAAPTLHERVQQLASLLRCPVCQNLSVADSPSELAVQMREQIHEMMEQGKTDEEIRDYFVSKYGEWVLLSPTKKGFNLLVWVLPIVGIGAGGVGLYRLSRRWLKVSEPSQDGAPGQDAEYKERIQAELKELDY